MSKKKVITEEMKQLLRNTADRNSEIATAARLELAIALRTPIKQAVMDGDITSNIYETIGFDPGSPTEFPLDLITPGTEGDHTAYVIPNHGRIPEKHVESSSLFVKTYEIGSSIDWNLRFSRNARWDVVSRAMQVLEAGFIRKNNIDAWRTIIMAVVGRNIMVSDSAAANGLFTKRLVALAETIMRRRAGGNSTSTNRGRLTDVFMSPEAHQDVLSWDLTQIPESVRSQIWMNWENGGITQIGRTKLHDLDELGVDQEFNDYFTELGGTFPGTKTELVIGLDLENNDSFVHPVVQELEVFEDPTFHRQRRASLYGNMEGGWAVLDGRRTLGLCI